MADVNDLPRRARDRGQMLLVAAFGVAVMLVALALILNTSIYTENIATRGSDISGGKDATRYRAATQTFVEDTITVVNYRNNSSDSELENNLRWSVWNYSNMSGRQQALDSIVTDVTVKSRSEGTRIYNTSDGSGNFSNTEGDRNWTAVQSAEVRDFTIEADTLMQKDTTAIGAVVPGNSPVFRINFSAGPDNWYRVYIFEEKGSADLNVTVEGETGGTAVSRDGCSRSSWGSTAEIDVTGGTVEGDRCQPLERVADIKGSSYDVDFNFTKEGSNTIEGNYSLVAETASITSSPPDEDHALYSATVHLGYESKRLTMETDIRAAPGEFDD